MYSERCTLSNRVVRKDVSPHDWMYNCDESKSILKDDLWCKCDSNNHEAMKSVDHYENNRQNVDILCEQFNGMFSGEYEASLFKLYPTIPNHDKRILNCMLLKRFNDTLDVQNALMARRYWEQEKDDRIALSKKQQSEYFNTVREKQEIEKLMRDERLNTLCKQQENYVDMMRQEQYAKRLRCKKRLAKVQYERNLMQYQRKMIEKRKLDQIVNARCRLKVDEQIRKYECNAELNKRMQRADFIRKHHLNINRKRVVENNERHQMTHALVAEEIKAIDRLNLRYLKDKIADCDRKSNTIRMSKMQWIEESRDRAQITATLRDIVRKSATPDNFLYSV